MAFPQVLMELRRIGEYLPCTAADIDWALSLQASEAGSGNVKHIGEILIERETISRENLVEALELQRMDRLRGCALLAGLTGEELQSVANRSEEIALASGETLFTEGRAGNSIYIVLSGRIILSRAGEIHGEVPIAAAGRGDVLGATDHLVCGTRCCSAYATEPSVVLKVQNELLPVRMQSCGRNLCVEFPDQGPAAALISQILKKAARLLGADRAYVLFRDLETGDFHGWVSDGEQLREWTVPAGTNVAGWVALKRRIVNIPEAYCDVRFDPELDVLTGYWTRTLLSAPVFNAQCHVIAVLEAVNKLDGLFNEDDEALLNAFARQSAATIDRCRIAP